MQFIDRLSRVLTVFVVASVFVSSATISNSARAGGALQPGKYVGSKFKSDHAVSAGMVSTAKQHKPYDPEMIPIHLAATVIVGGQSALLGITVSLVPSEGGSVRLTCGTPGMLKSPSGAWPCIVNYPPGASVIANVSITAKPVLWPTFVTLYAGPTDADPNDLSQWTVAGTVLILPGL